MDKAKTFVFNLEWVEVLKDYPAEVRYEVYDAIMWYAASGTLPELKPLAKMAFSFIKKEMDYNRSRYDTMVERRREAGKLGGRPRKPQGCDENQLTPEKPQGSDKNQMVSEKPQGYDKNQMVLKKPYNDNVNDNVNDNIEKEKVKKKIGGMPPEIKDMFVTFYKSYHGTKNGLDRTLRDFIKKHPDYVELIPRLMPALEAELEWRKMAGAAGMFVPEPKNLNTWLNQECWDQVLQEITPKPQRNATTTPLQSDADARRAECLESIALDLAGYNDIEPDITGLL